MNGVDEDGTGRDADGGALEGTGADELPKGTDDEAIGIDAEKEGLDEEPTGIDPDELGIIGIEEELPNGTDAELRDGIGCDDGGIPRTDEALPLGPPGTLETDGIDDSDGKLDDPGKGANVPVPTGNELLPGKVTIRLDDREGLIELTDPTGAETEMLPLGNVLIWLEETGPTLELTEPTGAEFDTLLPGMLPMPLEDPGSAVELPEAGMIEILLPGTLLSGGTTVDPEEVVHVVLVEDSVVIDHDKGSEEGPGLNEMVLLELQEYPVPVPQWYPVPVPQ